MSARVLFGVAAGVLAAGMVATVEVGRRRLVAERDAARRDATTDGLTGLANRAGLEAGLARLVEAGQPYGLLMVDLDGFKQVNDTYGHAAGNAVLVEVGRRLVDLVDDQDNGGVAARLGGDEFVVAFPAGAPVLAAELAHEALALIKLPVWATGKSVQVGASVGVVHAGTAEPIPAVLHTADIAMYQAKEAGGGVVERDPVAGLVTPLADKPSARLRDMVAFGRGMRAVTA
ncbi:GGDEF domain-containing protein [Polymorphospora sp. NPDC050346]|uniref:GGDEF domain-containing protein n=1 Tax=Polymorphospora sp. NPDC050346 TaxID=3155780 RepID=UPI003408AFF3